MKATFDVKGSLGIDAEQPNDQQESAVAQKIRYVMKTEVKTMSTFPKTTNTDSLMISFLGISLVGITITVKYFEEIKKENKMKSFFKNKDTGCISL